MVLLYTEEQKGLIALVRDMTEHEIKPSVQEAGKKGECPRELFDWGLKMGPHMLGIPAQYGGTDLSYETTAMIFEELAKVDAGYAITLVTTFVTLRSMILTRTPEQAQHFTGIIDKGSLTSFALTESSAGSDPTGIRGTAVVDGDEYMLNATKTFITNGALPDIYVGSFKTDPEAGHKGTSAFITDRGTPGAPMSVHENKMGLRLSNTTDLIFGNVRVPKSRILGPEGSGFKLVLNVLDLSRTLVTTLTMGTMWRAPDEAVKYVEERKRFNTPTIRLQMVQALLADMAIRVEASRCLMNNTMKLMDAGDLVQKEGFIAKTFVMDCAQKVISNAVQAFGGYGYNREYPVGKLMWDVKVFRIFEGTNQIQRITIANVLNKEYKQEGGSR